MWSGLFSVPSYGEAIGQAYGVIPLAVYTVGLAHISCPILLKIGRKFQGTTKFHIMYILCAVVAIAMVAASSVLRRCFRRMVCTCTVRLLKQNWKRSTGLLSFVLSCVAISKENLYDEATICRSSY